MWYAVVTHGLRCGLPRGPWRSLDEALDAIGRWRRRAGSDAGTHLAASNARLYGYETRARARRADISHAPDEVYFL